MDHFANAVYSASWRLVADFAGRPTHCKQPVAWTGRARISGRSGKVLRVWSCEGHCEGLESARTTASPMSEAG
jgi:hypothetical protein